jgi:hypothetical protein
MPTSALKGNSLHTLEIHLPAGYFEKPFGISISRFLDFSPKFWKLRCSRVREISLTARGDYPL